MLACGIYSNVIRILVPLVVADVDLERGLDALEDSLTSAAASWRRGGPGTRAREGLTRAAGRRHRPSPVRELELPDGSPRRADRQSGGTSHAGRVEAVRRVLAEAGPVETLETRARGHAAEVAADACQRYDEIFVYGGDGVFNEAVNGMLPSVPIGFIPGGATSVLPRALGLPRDPLACARRPRVRETRGGSHWAASTGAASRSVPPRARRGDRAARRPARAEERQAAERRRLRGRYGSDRRTPEGEDRAHHQCRRAWALCACSWPRTAIRTPSLDRCRFAAPLAQFELGLDLVRPRQLTLTGFAHLVWSLVVRPGLQTSETALYAHDIDGAKVACDAPTPLQVDGRISAT